MNTLAPPPDEPQDERLSRLYRETGAPEPGADLDAAILAAAHREAHARPRLAGSPLRRWRVPVSIAAVVVISASLVTLMVEEGGDRLNEQQRALRESMPRAAPAPASPQPDQSAPAGPAAGAVAEPAARLDDTRLAPKRKDASGTARPPSEHERAAAAQGAARYPSKIEQAPAVPPTPSTAPQPFAAPPPASEAARGETAGRPAQQQDATAPAAPDVVLRDRAPSDGPVGRLQSAPRRDLAEDSGAPLPAAPRARSSPGARGVDEPSLSRAPAGAATEVAAAKAAARPAPSPRGAALARELVDQPPEKWLERVEQLRREDRNTDADELLAEFRKRFPDYPVPTRPR